MRSACPVRRAAQAKGGQPALRFGGVTWDYLELDRQVDAWCRWLGSCGVGQRGRVWVCSANRPELVMLLYAAPRCGAATVLVNPRLGPVERAALRSRHQATLELDEADLARVGSEIAGPVGGSADWRPGAPRSEQVADHDDLPFVGLFTSGTTAVPKLVQLSQVHLRASAKATAENLGRGGVGAQHWLCVMPLCHVAGVAMAYRCAEWGALLDLEPGFDAERTGRLLALGVTHTSLVSTMLVRLLATHPGRFPSVVTLVGGGPVSASLLRRAGEAGLEVLHTYGLTEACSQVSTERLGEVDGTTCGHPIRGVEVSIRGPRGAEPTGEVGEIWVRGPTVAVPPGHWLPTGDLGAFDVRGRLTVFDRRDDLIVCGGENLSPLEIEAVVGEHPEVVEVAVVPSPDEEWGQVPVAFVVTRNGGDFEELTRYTSARLASIKVPRRWVPVEALPRTDGGKVLRRRLQEAALALG